MDAHFFNFVSFYYVLLVFAILPIYAVHQQCFSENCGDRKEGSGSLRDFSDLGSNFENGGTGGWIDESQSGVKWSNEDYTDSASWENGSRAPQPLNGSKYIRVHREVSPTTLSITFGVAILRSPLFKFLPEDANFSFSFWIRSKWPQFNNLEVKKNSAN